MKRCLGILFALSLVFAPKAHGQVPTTERTTGILKLVQTIPLPTQGYMDRIAVDVKGQRLFISGEHNHALVVVDLKAGKAIHQTALAASPKKPVYLPDTNEIWVNLEDASVVCISGTTYEITKVVPLTGFGDPNRGGDNGAYDPATHLFYAAVEVFTPDALEAFKGGIPIAYSGSDNHVPSGASIDIVDTKTGKMIDSIKMPGGDPAGVAMEPSGKTLYVTMGDIIGGESHVAVVDLEKRAVIAQWPITGGPVPHTAGLDPIHHRLFVGSRIHPHTGEFGGGHQYVKRSTIWAAPMTPFTMTQQPDGSTAQGQLVRLPYFRRLTRITSSLLDKFRREQCRKVACGSPNGIGTTQPCPSTSFSLHPMGQKTQGRTCVLN